MCDAIELDINIDSSELDQIRTDETQGIYDMVVEGMADGDFSNFFWQLELHWRCYERFHLLSRQLGGR
jgi:hypothetical protein